MRIAHTAVAALALIVSASLAHAGEVRVLSVGSTQVGAKALAADFTKATGHTVNFTIRPPFNIDEEFGKNTFDVLILSVQQWTPTTRPATSRPRAAWRLRASASAWW